MSSTIAVDKEAIADLVRVKNEFDSIVESLELMANRDFMNSYKKSKEQIRNKEFVDWDDL